MDSQPNGVSTPSVPAQGARSLPTPPPAPPPSHPTLSTQIPGHDKRPRDARLIHLLLTSLSVSAYQERVPLQLLDFAYRHTSALLADSLHLSSDAYISQQNRAREPPAGGAMRDADGQVGMNAVQLAIQSRLQYQLGAGGMGKEFLMEMAEQRNKMRLPAVGQTEWGVRLPSEKFVLTGVPWGLREEWEKESEDGEGEGAEEGAGDGMGDVKMEEAGEDEGVFGEDAEGGTFDDVFGGGEDEVMGEDA